MGIDDCDREVGERVCELLLPGCGGCIDGAGEEDCWTRFGVGLRSKDDAEIGML